jgi:hypothetical protein
MRLKGDRRGLDTIEFEEYIHRTVINWEVRICVDVAELTTNTSSLIESLPNTRVTSGKILPS